MNQLKRFTVISTNSNVKKTNPKRTQNEPNLLYRKFREKVIGKKMRKEVI
jgi:hypothetical protein